MKQKLTRKQAVPRASGDDRGKEDESLGKGGSAKARERTEAGARIR